MINLRTASAKRKEAARQVRLSLRLERPFADQLRKEFAKVAREASAEIRKAGDAAVAIRHHQSRLLEIMTRHYRVIGHTFFARTRAAFGPKRSRRRRQVKGPNGDVTAVVAEATVTSAFDDFWPDLQRTVARKVDQISGTTRERIQARVTTGVRDGDSWSDIADGIEEAGVDSLRAEVIAQTEAHSVAQASNVEAASGLGLALTKEWVAVEDARTRPDHAEADGEEVGMDDMFLIGGATMAFPGDPNGPPEQVVNCRCATVFNVQE